MRKRFLSMLLLVLVGVAGNLTALAQTPEPSGQWKFDNTSDLMAATVGNVMLSPAVMGDASISPASVSEAGITVAEGPNGSSAIFVPKTAALKVTRAEGAASSTNFSFMIDLKVPNAYGYDGLFQTNGNNANDGDLFISKSQIGLGGYLGGYYGCIWNDMWYRIIMTNSDGSVKVYVNGEKVIDYATTDGRFEIDPVFYLHADDDGEMSDTYISEVAFWETPLADEEAIALGSLDDSPWITDASAIKEGDQFYIISDRGKFNGTKTAKPKAMSTLQSNYAANWGEQYVYWGDLNEEADGFVWTAKKVGDQWAFLNKEKNQYIGNMNEGEADVIFSDDPVGYTLTDLAEGAGKFYMTNDESEHSLHVQGYLRSDRGNNSLAKQNVGDDDYADADVARNGYPGRWRLLKLNADEPVDPRTQIGTAEEFEAFAQAVADGQTELDAVLTADIELTGNVMVGTSTNQYAGTFDGAEHKVTYNYDITSNYCGLFAYVNNATIRNLYVEGTVVSTAIHFGALIGQANGTVLVENVVTNVDITGNRSGVTGDGGMLGANYAQITFNNCATLGKMGNPGSSMYSSFSAWSNGSSMTILNNCYTACELKEGTGTGNCFTLTHTGGPITLNNCYYLNEIGTVQGTAITEEQLASGEFCYTLNGDQSTIGWYQTLDGDAQPVPFASHAQVYANGELKCDGTSAGGTLVYSNSATSTIPPHTFEGGWCSVCGTLDVNYLTPDDAGYYNIGTANELAWYAEFLALGKPCGNVKLTADIDLSTSAYPNTMIATEGNPFSGIFDGQEHTITYNYTNVTEKWRGLFRSVKNATIRNLRVEGNAVSTNIHFGALIGVAYEDVLVENVVTNVDITGKSTTGVQGDGGMLGANYANITFNNCAVLGKMGNSGTSMYSPFSGWSNGSSSVTLNNCYTTCEFKDGTTIDGNSATLTHGGTSANYFNNCYYLNYIDKQQGTPITEDLANGEFCYKLNGDQSVIGWYQTIGTDALPVPFASHAQVYANGAVRCDGAELPDAPITYSNTEGQITKPDHQYDADGICTVCGSPKQNAEGYYLIDTAQKLNWFATKISEGTTSLNALLTADIDLSTSDYPDLMIGTEAAEFAGVFDGGGHTITYHYALVADKWRGLFAFVRDATIRNLYVEGSAVVTNIHYGALIGRAYGNVLVENVITNVNITGQRSGVTGDGGMLGANYANITFNNCATLGEMGNENTSMYSSFSAWSNGTSSTTLNNCYSLCSLTEGTGEGNCFTLTHKSGTVVINNSYYLNLIGTYVGGTQVTEEEVANGSLCARLGAGWYQNIGEDAYPIFDKTHAIVREITEAGYATMYIPDAVTVPEGVQVFTGKIDEEWLKLSAVEGTVPAWEPVVLKGAPGFYGFKPATPEEKSTEIAFVDWGVENGVDLQTTKVGGLTFSFDQGANTGYAPKYYTSGYAIRLYAGNAMTISAPAPITKIEFSFVSGYEFKSENIEISDGEYTGSTWTGNAESVTFTNTSSKQWRIVKMTITYAGYPDNIADNDLKGTAEDLEADGTQYILAKPEGKSVGFYNATAGTTIPAGKAYLEPENASGIKAFLFEGDDATGIENIDNGQQTTDKGQLIYNLAGQRLQRMQKGINIVNGKKILVK